MPLTRLPLFIALGWIFVAHALDGTAAEPSQPRSEIAQESIGDSFPDSQAFHEPAAAIDFFIESRWEADGVRPTPRCDDRTFVRRVYRDLVGRIPTRQETDSFVTDDAVDKRQRLVHRLLESTEYGRHMADVFDVVLMGRGERSEMAQRDRHGWRSYLNESFNDNRPWNAMARDMILARVDKETDVRASWFLYERDEDHQAIAESIAPAFFGIRIECAQCHDHPLADEILQGHYWGLVAFFQRSKNEMTDSGPRVAESATGAFSKFTDLAGANYDAELTFYASTVIPEPKPDQTDEEVEQADDAELYNVAVPNEPPVPIFSRREKFVEEILLVHPMLSRAFVNRVWALMLGRGFVHPVDRMDSMHEVSHPRLLEWLADDFADSGYDVKRLVKNIVLSRPYQCSAPEELNPQPESFSYAIEKPLSAESFLRSITHALNPSHPEMDSELLVQFRSKFGAMFAEEPGADASQSLFLTNNALFNQMISESDLIQKLMEQPTEIDQVQLAFETILGRDPDSDELATAKSFLAAGSPERVSQLVWALVTSAEFRFNH